MTLNRTHSEPSLALDSTKAEARQTGKTLFLVQTPLGHQVTDSRPYGFQSNVTIVYASGLHTESFGL
jgi:hypothetical protein